MVPFPTNPRLMHNLNMPHSFLLYLSVTTELLIINLIPQHDPQSDPQLACHRHARLSQTFVNQFAAVETLQLWIAACRMCTCLTPEKPQQGTALFGHSAEPLMLSTGVFPRDDAYITRQRLAISETLRIAQEYFGRQCRHRPHYGMGHQ